MSVRSRVSPEPAAPVTNRSDETRTSLIYRLRSSTAFKEFACYFYAINTGFTDSSAGPLLPYLQTHYHVNYTVVSTLFVCQCTGSVLASFLNPWISQHFGIGKALTLGAAVQMIGYALLPPALPFPVFDIAYAILGFGVAIQFAQANAFIANRPKASQRLGLLHGFYGLGGVAGPLAATAFVKSVDQFLLFYLVGLGMSITNFLLFTLSFQLRREKDPRDLSLEMQTQPDTSEVDQPSSQEEQRPLPKQERSMLAKVMRQRLVWLMIPYAFIYIGAEVTIGGWIVSYLITERNGGTGTGYVSSGYWGGLAVGRMLLPAVNVLIGEKRVVTVYTVVAIGLELVVWLVPSLVGGAIATAFVGVLMGPFFPIALTTLTKVVPKAMHAGTIGFVTSLGQSGSAIFPFITGAMAQRFGVSVLEPMLVAMFGAMGCIWIFTPNVDRRTA